ncbi:hypothetical protein SteCoe_5949 [Stentor coeruleus]|uniref:Uncharacterized protein n=1 Tax=Stentor coeruleus TaxID=5963 RepID=A0A1R2CR46_9CILI|nr:hypothetical protein SteCoe_5949 [Stentor coeruleus]
MSNSLKEQLVEKSDNSKGSLLLESKKSSNISESRKDYDVEELSKVLKYIQSEHKLGLSSSLISSFNGHTGSVVSVSFSPDGKFWATGSFDNQIKIWNLTTKKEEFSLIGHTSYVSSICFSPDGKILASGSGDKSIKLWDLNDKKETITLKGHTGTIWSLCFTSDSKTLISGSGDKSIKLWNISEQKEEFTLTGHSSYVSSISLSKNGKLLASGSHDKTIKLWNLTEKQLEYTLSGHTNSVTSVCFSPDGKFISSGSKDNSVKIWNLSKKKDEFTFCSHTSPVTCICYRPDGKYLVSCSEDKTVKIFNMMTKIEECSLIGHTEYVRCVSYSPDNKFLVSVSEDKLCKLWNLTQKKEDCTFTGHLNGVTSLSFSSDGRFLASGSEDNMIKLWNLSTRNEEFTFIGHTNGVTSVSFSPNCKYLVSGSVDNTIIIWNLDNKLEECKLLGHNSYIFSVVFSPDGKYLCSGSEDTTLKVWNFTEKSLETTLNGHSEAIKSLSFSPDGRYIASGSYDRSIKIWNFIEKKEEFTLVGHTDGITTVSFSKDGRFVASGSDDRSIKIWSISLKKEIFMFTGHKDTVWSVSFSPDGKFLASGSFDNTIKIWNLAEKKEESTLNGLTELVRCVSFSHDGKYIASGSGDSLIKMWDLIEIKSEISRKYMKISLDGRFLAIKNDNESIRVVCINGNDSLCTIRLLEKNIEDLNFSNNSALLHITYPDMIKTYDIFTGIEISSTTKSQTNAISNKIIKSFDPLSCSGNGYQNILHMIETYSQLQNKTYDKIKDPNLCFSNMKFTTAHFFSMLGLDIQLENFINSKKLVLFQDEFGHGPIYYSIKCQHQRITDMLVDYMYELIETEIYSPKTYLSLSLIECDLPDMLINSSPQLDQLLSVSLFMQESLVYFGNPLSQLPIKKFSQYSRTSFDQYTSKIGETLPLVLKQTPFRLPSAIGTYSSINLITSILSCTNTEIYRTEIIQLIIKQKWEEVIGLIYFYTILLWMNLGFLFLFLSTQSLFYIYCVFGVNIILILWEFVQVCVFGFDYFRSSINFLDLIRFFTTISFGILAIFYTQYTILTWVMMALNLIRGFTGFRAFGNTRYYIKLLLACIFRMKDFLIVFIYTTLSLGILNAISTGENVSDYLYLWSSPFGLVVGKTDYLLEKNTIQIITYIIAVTANLIIMLNLIISILGDVFDEFQLDAEIYDYSEMAEFILEAEQIISLVYSVDEYKYLHVCDNAYNRIGQAWRGNVMDIRDFLRDKFLKNDLKPLFEQNNNAAEENIQQLKENFRFNFMAMNDRVANELQAVEGKFQMIEENIAINKKCLDEKIDSLQENYNHLEEKIGRIEGNIELILSIISK